MIANSENNAGGGMSGAGRSHSRVGGEGESLLKFRPPCRSNYPPHAALTGLHHSSITNLRKEERFTIRFHFEISLNACLRSYNNGNYSETPKRTEMPSLGRVISKAFQATKSKLPQCCQVGCLQVGQVTSS